MTESNQPEDAKRSQRFSKIELLFAIAIAGVLAGCAGPAIQQAQKKAQQNKAMQYAKGIAQGLRIYSLDEDGSFPSGENANEAFANLFPEMGIEKPFYVRGSAWHGRRFADGPDELIGDDDGGQPLEPGENHWAFNRMADEGHSPPDLPLIADGFSSQVGRYSSDPGELGGVWGGRTAIVIFCDYSAMIVKLDRNGRYLNPIQNNRDEFLRPGVDMINPAHPVR